MEVANIALDFVLFFCAIWMIVAVRGSGLGGVVGGSLTTISIGAIVLGIAHIAETITFEVIKLENVPLGELIHRGIVLVGFILLVIGIKNLGKLAKDEPEDVLN